jgi:hypothetical protein
MLDELACTCEGRECSRTLTDDECVLIYRTDAGERRAYECACGAVTVTVHR